MAIKKHELEAVRDLLAEVLKETVRYQTLTDGRTIAEIIHITRKNLSEATVVLSSMVENANE